VTVEGTTTPLPTPRNGQFQFTVTTDDPEPLPPTPMCPNDQWTPNIVDVAFTTATLTLVEDNVQSDQVVCRSGSRRNDQGAEGGRAQPGPLQARWAASAVVANFSSSLAAIAAG
jgi:hypothetical protein